MELCCASRWLSSRKRTDDLYSGTTRRRRNDAERGVWSSSWQLNCIPVDTYFFQFGDHGPIKIGKSGNFKKRLRNTETLQPEAIRLLLCLEGDCETQHHRQFEHLLL